MNVIIFFALVFVFCLWRLFRTPKRPPSSNSYYRERRHTSYSSGSRRADDSSYDSGYSSGWNDGFSSGSSSSDDSSSWGSSSHDSGSNSSYDSSSSHDSGHSSSGHDH